MCCLKKSASSIGTATELSDVKLAAQAQFQLTFFTDTPAGATLFSFVAALCFFLLELFVYQTVGWQSALQPLIVAGE